MSIVDVQYHIRTVTCNSCEKTVTYEHPKDLQKTVDENPWMKSSRMVMPGDNRQFIYCSDLCEVKGIETGLHNIVEKPTVEIPTGSAQAQIQAAAAAAKQQELANKAIKDGAPIKLIQP